MSAPLLRPFVLALSGLLATGALAQPAPAEAALAQAMARCAGVMHVVTQEAAGRRLRMDERDARAMTRYTMLATAALLGEAQGLVEARRHNEQFRSKLALTRPDNINRILDSEATACVRAVDEHKEAVNKKLVRMPPKEDGTKPQGAASAPGG